MHSIQFDDAQLRYDSLTLFKFIGTRLTKLCAYMKFECCFIVVNGGVSTAMVGG
jgi:hypothetical protein